MKVIVEIIDLQFQNLVIFHFPKGWSCKLNNHLALVIVQLWLINLFTSNGFDNYLYGFITFNQHTTPYLFLCTNWVSRRENIVKMFENIATFGQVILNIVLYRLNAPTDYTAYIYIVFL
jgi:hypothetical protein